jgi:hypothetical protein
MNAFAGAGGTSQGFHVVAFMKPLICRTRATSEGTSFSKWGKQAMEKSHETDESDNGCYCSLDVCVCGAALLRLV